MGIEVGERASGQPESDRVWRIETHGIDPIPDADRHGKPSELFWVWCAANISILGIAFYGAAVVAFYRLNVWQGILAGTIGTIAGFVLVGFISVSGKRSGAPTLVLSRAPFGVLGNALPTLVSYVSLVGWEIALVALSALAATTVLDRLGYHGATSAKLLGFLITAAATIAIALLGHATIVRIQTWFTWAFAALTVVFMALLLPQIDVSKLAKLPTTDLVHGFLPATSIIIAGLGIGWVNAAADYSRYLPRSASSRGVFGWTVFGASIAPIILIVFGVLLAGTNAGLASSANPIGDLAEPLPTWFLVPYLVIAVGGLLAGALLDIYSSGLNLLTLGLRVPRYQSVAIDGVLMLIGNIYILFVAKNFISPFIGFLVTLGVLLASWSSVFLVDLWLFRRRAGYDESALFDVAGRYGAVNPTGVLSFLIASVVGLGLVTSFSPVFSWTGYLLGPLGGKTGAIGSSSIGLLIAFVLAGLLYALLGSLVPRRHPERP